jgi:hypothetical protein
MPKRSRLAEEKNFGPAFGQKKQNDGQNADRKSDLKSVREIAI